MLAYFGRFPVAIEMHGLTDRNYFMIAVAVYGLSTLYSIFLWRKGFCRDDRINYAVLFLGFAFHTTAMVKRGFTLSRCPVNNLYEAITFIVWAITLAYLVIGLWPRLRFLGAFGAPVLLAVGAFALLPAFDPPGTRGSMTSGRTGGACMRGSSCWRAGVSGWRRWPGPCT